MMRREQGTGNRERNREFAGGAVRDAPSECVPRTTRRFRRTPGIRSLLPVPCSLLLLLLGCGFSVKGEWDLVRAIPNRDVFAIDDARFEDDDRFTATVTFEGRTHEEAGRYRFNGHRLTLHPDGGGVRTYDASVKFGELVIRADDERRVILRKTD